MMRILHSFRRDTRGAILIETAFAAPVLAVMMLGAYDVSRMVARQMELQEVAAEIAAASMAKKPDDAQVAKLKLMAQASGKLSASQVTLTRKIKCGTDTTLYADNHSCAVGVETSTLITIALSTTYVPMWTSFGVGAPVPLAVNRSVQVS